MTSPRRSAFRSRPTRPSRFCSGPRATSRSRRSERPRLREYVRRGFIAEVSVAVTPQLKTIAGRLAYLIGGAQALLEFDPVGATSPSSRAASGCRPALHVRGLQLAPDRRRPAHRSERGDRRRPARRLPDRVDERARVRRAGAEGGGRRPRQRSAGLYFQARHRSSSSWSGSQCQHRRRSLQRSRCEYRVLPRAARFFAGDVPTTVAGAA